MTDAYRQSIDDVLREQAVDPAAGLADAEVHARRRRYGPNRLREIRGKSAWRILVDQLESLVVILLFAAAVAAVLFGRAIEGVAIGAALVVNAIIGFVMEIRAVRSMEALRRMGRVAVKVRRAGGVKALPGDELVPGDIVVLEAGDIITADLRLIESANLQCDESALTGESVPVAKTLAPIAGDVPAAERTNMAWKGTSVTQGSGSGVAIATGMQTELGRISALVEEAQDEVTPLERRLAGLGRNLIWLCVGIAVIIATAGLLAGQDLRVMLETAIALAIAAVPEGLPVVATIALARGMHRMARRNAVVKRLSAVEALGAANVIVTDKTGTLTENRMAVSRFALASGDVLLDEAGNGSFVRDGQPTEVRADEALRCALEVGVLCNNASLAAEGAAEEGVGDPLELALLAAARTAGIEREALLAQYPEVHEEGFDPDLKMMATVHRDGEKYRIAVKGAPEAVLAACNAVRTAHGEEALAEEQRGRWCERNAALAQSGLRVIALAEKHCASGSEDAPYEDLMLLGLAGLHDPPRPEVKPALAACRRAGVRVVMATGDHGATARAIAQRTELAREDELTVVEGPELRAPERLAEDERERLLRCNVFARISPQQKLELVDLYQRAGLVVGMTGDGVNDAPALKKADIGIAMGRRGTEVAREAADMVLKDDAFATIVVAIEEGRIIFDNIRKFIIYLLSGNLGEIIAISFAALANAPLPLLPLQILFINFVSDVLPALALGVGRGSPRVMDRRPRRADEPVLTRLHWYASGGYGLIIALAVLGGFACALAWLDMPAQQAVSISFLTFGFARLGHVLNMRAPGSGLILNEVTRNRFVWVAIAVGLVLLLAAVQVPLLAHVLDTVHPGPAGWGLILGFASLPVLIGQVLKLGGLWWERREEVPKPP